MHGSRRPCKRGYNFHKAFFQLMRGGRIKNHYNQAIIGPPACSLACRWWPNIECWLGWFTIFSGSGAVLLRNLILLWFFKGSGSAVTHSGSAHACQLVPYAKYWLNGKIVLAHQIRISNILFWARKSYPTYDILPKLSREVFILYLAVKSMHIKNK